MLGMIKSEYHYLNTSHVLIHLIRKKIMLRFIRNLNTSHVLIHPTFLRTFHLYSISYCLIFQSFQTILPTVSLF